MLRKLEGPEVVLIGAVSFYALAGAVGLAFGEPDEPRFTIDTMVVERPPVRGPLDAAEWFRSVRQHCNPVEVGTHLSRQPAPSGHEGKMYEAACYALAGRIGQARDVIQSLPPRLRPQAAGVVFETGHPAADAGDDVAAGPLMELVVEYWPNHYMALYHAGAARFELGDHMEAGEYLRRFLQEYGVDDGWTRSARSMLEQIAREGP